jgi:uncharacterized membrane protein
MGRRGNRPQGRRQRWRREARPRVGRGRRYGAGGGGGRGGGGGILLTIVLLAAIAFGVWYFVIRDDGTADVTPTITPSPTVTVSSSPEGET